MCLILIIYFFQNKQQMFEIIRNLPPDSFNTENFLSLTPLSDSFRFLNTELNRLLSFSELTEESNPSDYQYNSDKKLI